MELSKREKNGFQIIYNYVTEHKDELYEISTKNDWYYDCKFIRCDIESNTSDKANPGYEEYTTLVFLNYDGEIKINYHTLPYRISVCEEEVVFDFHNYLINSINNNNKKKLIINFSLFQLSPYDEIEIETGIDIIDNDKIFYDLVNDVYKLISSFYKETKEGKRFFNEKLEEKSKEELLIRINKVIDRANEINDGSYFVIDLITPQYIQDEEHVGFNEKDFMYIKEESGSNLLNIGSNYYVKGDYEKAYPYYLSSALTGNIQAISNLGYCFMYGRSIPVNKDLALTCFIIASNHGVVEASYKLGSIYKYDDQYKDMEMSKYYFLKAINSLADYFDYVTYPSLCLELARDKLYNPLFEKDLYGAYLLLKIAESGYRDDLKRGFNPHEKQYHKTLELLNNDIFNECKEWYQEFDETSYLFSLAPFNKEEFSEELKINDSIVLLVEQKEQNINGESVVLPIGLIGRVCEVHRYFVVLEIAKNSSYDGVYMIDKTCVRKYTK